MKRRMAVGRCCCKPSAAEGLWRGNWEIKFELHFDTEDFSQDWKAFTLVTGNPRSAGSGPEDDKAAGLKYLLYRLLMGSPIIGGHWTKLFANDFTPDANSVLGDFTNDFMNFNWHAAHNATDTIAEASHVTIESDPFNFNFDAGGGERFVYGFYNHTYHQLSGGYPVTVPLCQRFDTPFLFDESGDEIDVRSKYNLYRWGDAPAGKSTGLCTDEFLINAVTEITRYGSGSKLQISPYSNNHTPTIADVPSDYTLIPWPSGIAFASDANSPADNLAVNETTNEVSMGGGSTATAYGAALYLRDELGGGTPQFLGAIKFDTPYTYEFSSTVQGDLRASLRFVP